MIAVGLLLCGATVAVHVGEARGLDPTEVSALAAEVGRAIEARTASVAAVDDVAWSGCDGAPTCVDAIRQRLGATEVVLLRAFAVGSRLRATLERVGEGGEPRALDLARDARAWREPVASAVRAMFRAGSAPPIATAPPGAVERAWWPWAAAGVGVVAVGVGVGLGAASASTFSDLESGAHPATPAEASRAAARTQALAANVLFGVAVAALVVGAVGWLTE